MLDENGATLDPPLPTKGEAMNVQADRDRLAAVVDTYTALREAEEKATGEVRTAIERALKVLGRYPVRVR